MSKTLWPYCNYLRRFGDEAKAVEQMVRIEKLLAPHLAADVPKAYRKEAMPEYCFLGECFGRAIQYVSLSRHLPESVYVLGEAACGGMGQHGWVELPGGIVFDGVLQEFYTSGYMSQAKQWYRFDRAGTMYAERMSKRYAKHSYRWDCVLNLPRSKYGDVPVLTLEDVQRYWRERKKDRGHDRGAGTTEGQVTGRLTAYKCRCKDPKNYEAAYLVTVDGEVRVVCQCAYCNTEGLLKKERTTEKDIEFIQGGQWSPHGPTAWMGIPPVEVKAMPGDYQPEQQVWLGTARVSTLAGISGRSGPG
jgi:hypothetical protein